MRIKITILALLLASCASAQLGNITHRTLTLTRDSTPSHGAPGALGTAEELRIFSDDSTLRAQLGLGGAVNQDGILTLRSSTGSIASLSSEQSTSMLILRNGALAMRAQMGISSLDDGAITLASVGGSQISLNSNNVTTMMVMTNDSLGIRVSLGQSIDAGILSLNGPSAGLAEIGAVNDRGAIRLVSSSGEARLESGGAGDPAELTLVGGTGSVELISGASGFSFLRGISDPLQLEGIGDIDAFGSTDDIGGTDPFRDLHLTGVMIIDGFQVVGPRGTAVTDPAGGTTIDAEARTAIIAIIDRLVAHGLITP